MWGGGALSVTGVAEPERVEVLRVTDGIPPILKVQPALGRTFSAADDPPGSPLTGILTCDCWQRPFGGGWGVIGCKLIADGRPRVIIGDVPRAGQERYLPGLMQKSSRQR